LQGLIKVVANPEKPAPGAKFARERERRALLY
jgi:hypothetical protein